MLTTSAQYSATIIGTLCICASKKVEIDTDVSSRGLTIVIRTIGVNDISVVDICDPRVGINSQKYAGGGIAVGDIGRKLGGTCAFT